MSPPGRMRRPTGSLSSAQAIHANGRIEAQENNKVVVRLQRRRPPGRGAGEHPMRHGGKPARQQRLPLFHRPGGGIGRVGWQPKEAVGVDMRHAEAPPERGTKRRGAGA